MFSIELFWNLQITLYNATNNYQLKYLFKREMNV